MRENVADIAFHCGELDSGYEDIQSDLPVRITNSFVSRSQRQGLVLRQRVYLFPGDRLEHFTDPEIDLATYRQSELSTHANENCWSILVPIRKSRGIKDKIETFDSRYKMRQGAHPLSG